ncbi:MAG: riboflavin synthase [Defluviitaleaceae bacterium]|nr:riboflavin synthase [Defluviitaleaceae bacterium]
MFTGIIEEVGKVINVTTGRESAVLEISGNIIFSDMKLGDSISTNGVCLTVTSFTKSSFKADVMHTTLKASTLGELSVGSLVNLERAMQANSRFGGHIVSGHVDGISTIKSITPIGNSLVYTFIANMEFLKYMVPKGSIAIDGISLTISDIAENSFSVSIIPHTAKETVLANKKPNDKVNIELDILGKYVGRLLSFGAKKETITQDFLEKHGYK